MRPLRKMRRVVSLQSLHAILPAAVLDDVAIECHGKRADHITPATMISLADGGLLSLLRGLKAALNDGENAATANFLARAAAAHILHSQAVHTHSVPALARAARLSKRHVRRIQQYIRSNLSRDILIDDLARHIGISRASFARRFKASTGMTPHRFIVEMRVRHAAALLADDGLTIAEVAVRSGFASRSHLSVTFRRFLRVLPSAYRARS